MDEQNNYVPSLLLEFYLPLKCVLYSVVVSKNDFWATHAIQDENSTYKKTFENYRLGPLFDKSISEINL